MYENIKDAFYIKEIWDNQRCLIQDNHPETEKLLEIVYAIREEWAETDKAYEIVSQAVDIVVEWYDEDTSIESASVYTRERLDYLTIYNQDDITNIVKKYNCDIATACAYWYDERVRQAVNLLIEAYA